MDSFPVKISSDFGPHPEITEMREPLRLSWLKLLEPRLRSRSLPGGIVERFFFDAVIVRAGLAAKAANIVERLIAIPAGTLGLQVGEAYRLRGLGLPGRLSTIVNLVCITHDSAAIKKYWSAPDGHQAPHDGLARSACSIAARGLQCEQYSPKPAYVEKYGKKFDGVHRIEPPAKKSPPALRRRATLSTLEGTPARTASRLSYLIIPSW
ncbi:MAG TPA: hypothetical protein VEB70_05340 [Noviherbaspirillum sp.]|nr:hypothetical protein [Noviherbaspirillum sp.]